MATEDGRTPTWGSPPGGPLSTARVCLCRLSPDGTAHTQRAPKSRDGLPSGSQASATPGLPQDPTLPSPECGPRGDPAPAATRPPRRQPPRLTSPCWRSRLPAGCSPPCPGARCCTPPPCSARGLPRRSPGARPAGRDALTACAGGAPPPSLPAQDPELEPPTPGKKDGRRCESRCQVPLSPGQQGQRLAPGGTGGKVCAVTRVKSRGGGPP